MNAYQGRPRTRLVFWLAVTAVITLAGIVSIAAGADGRSVPRGALNSLLLGPEDLSAWEMVLDHVRSGDDVTRCTFEGIGGADAETESWSGPIVSSKGCLEAGLPVCEESDHCTCLRGPGFGISITFAIASSSEEAVSVAFQQVHSAAEIAPEVTGGEAVASFSDRAWYGDNARGYAGGVPTGATLTFVRGNVVALVSIGRRDGLDPHMVFDVAARLSRKIDAAAAGHPEPPPLLPPSAEEMHLDLEGAWAAYQSAKLLSGGKATTLAVQKGNGLARSVSAEAVGEREFIVPLAQLAGVLAAPERVKVAGDQASVKLAGGTLSMTRGKAEARYGGRIVPLSRAVEFRGGQVLVPLSIVEKALGQKVAWEKRGRYLVARLV